MSSEPNWSKNISNTSVCTWFFVLAILNAVLAVAGVLGALFSKGKGMLLPYILTGGVGFVNAWFLFLVCSRGLHEGFTAKMCASGPNMGKNLC